MTILSTFWSNLRSRLATAANETEVRDRFCGEVYAQYQLTFRLERGRSDAYHNCVILEFKDKGLFYGRINSAKFQEAYSKLVTKYIPQKAEQDGLDLQEYIGVAIDGEHYAFVFFEEDGQTRHTELIRIDLDGLRPLLSALQRDTRRPFTAENLLEDFGANTVIAKTLLQELGDHLNTCLEDGSGSQKVKMLFQEWQKLFAQVTSLGRVGQSRIDKHLQSIGMDLTSDYEKLLFVLHTYNALLFKLIAAEVVTAIRYEEYSGFSSIAASSSLPVLRNMLSDRIEHAQVFIANNIHNFIEGTFFSWYLEDTPDNLLEAIKEVLLQLGFYIYPTVTQDRIRDVLKIIYQDIVPRVIRKNIGEFYTPEWLVDFVLNETGYVGAATLDRKLLDPCCGTGNFLVHAIDRCKTAALNAGESKPQILQRILKNIIGFDLNPLAVISARLNYLMAIADILTPEDRIEIPVYLADAVYAPIRHENGGSPVRSYKVGTVMGSLDIVLPEALVKQQQYFGEILTVMEQDIEIEATRTNFIFHLQQQDHIRQAIDNHPDWINFIGEMFDKVKEMERQNWNRIWCRIVRNYFASVAIGEVHTIVSNPPWIRWSELPEEYRQRIKPTCEQYEIFSKMPFFGGNELDLSGLIAYAVTDKWLSNNGVLGFVITQIHFQAPSSQGFRCFQLPDGTPLNVSKVHDLTNVKPFPGLANKPAVFTWKRGSQTTYPVEYKMWEKIEPGAISEDALLEEVEKLTQINDWQAVALPGDLRWSILPSQYRELVPKLRGGSTAWQGRKGIMTDLNGAYFVEIIGPGPSARLVKIRTHPEKGRKPIPSLDWNVEGELIYPLLKGAGDFGPFRYTPSNLVAIIPNNSITSIPSEDYFSTEYRETYRYFRRINQELDIDDVPLLENRSTWRTRMKAQGAPFYAIYNVGDYTFAPYKVVWAEIARSLYSAVITSSALPHGLGTKLIVPDHKIYYVATDTEDKAHFLCAMLNSEPIKIFVDSFTVKIQVGSLFKSLKLPPYNEANPHHWKLVNLSKQAHASGVNSDLQSQIDSEAWKIIESIEADTSNQASSRQLSLPNLARDSLEIS